MSSTLSKLWLWFWGRACGFFLLPFCRLRVEGLEHVPRHGGVVLASNHLSMFDTLVIPYSISRAHGPHKLWAPAKEELFRNPVVAFILRSWGVFPVRRGRNDLRGIRRMLSLMRSDRMMLFPEGTRSRDGRLHEGNRMLGKLIHQAQPVVIPTLVVGTDGIMASGSWWPNWRTPVRVRYGRPLDLQAHYQRPGSKETSEAIVKEIMGAIAALMYNENTKTPNSFQINPLPPANGKLSASIVRFRT